MRSLRILLLGLVLRLEELSRSSVSRLLGAVWPLFLATVAGFRSGRGSTPLLSASLGASVVPTFLVAPPFQILPFPCIGRRSSSRTSSP